MDNLYLTGFMGAGKSTIGVELARALGRRFVDLDELVARRLGMPIPQAFARLGEAAFRSAETAELARVAGCDRLVVAVGGGVPESAANRQLMRASGRVLYLDVSLAACRARLGPAETASRPLWADEAELSALYARRRPLYARCDLSVLTDGLSPREVVAALCAELMPEEGLGRASINRTIVRAQVREGGG